LAISINRFKSSCYLVWAEAGLFWGQGLADLVFPPKCLICGVFITRDQRLGPDGLADFCPACRAGLLPLPQAHCLCCGRPFDTMVPSVHVCARCRKKKPIYDQALAAGLYEGALRKAIHGLKYSGRTELARPLAAFMADRLDPPFFPPQVDLILPVPLHRKRLRQRGFNQALLLARKLYHEYEALVRFDLLLRTRWTEPQVNLKGPERLANVRRAFALSDPAAVKNRSVLLMDDVYTTGATVNECGRVLKKAGADQVLVLTLARVA